MIKHNKDVRQMARRSFYTGGKPLLRVPLSKIEADDYDHTKNVIDFFIESSWFQDQTTANSGAYRDVYMLYDAYNGHIPEDYFNYVVNPYSSSRSDYRNFPARIRPYNIIRPNIDLLLGEYDKRPFNYTVTITDTDSLNSLQDSIYQAVLQTLEQMFINELNARNYPTGQPSRQVEPPAQIAVKQQSTYKDQRAKKGQAVLTNTERDLSLDLRFAELFKDWMIAGEVYTHKGVLKGGLFHDRVSPLDIDYDKSPGTTFIEDASWVTTRHFYSPSDIVTRFWDELRNDDVDDLEEQDSTLPFTSTYFNSLFGNTYRREEDLRRTKLCLYHVTWKFYRKIGFMTYTDEMGMEQQMQVSEDFKVTPGTDQKVEWVWIPEWWEGYRVDVPLGDPGTSSRGGLYFGIGPVLHQRNAMNNIAVCKGPYNGMRMSDTHSRNISPVEMGMPYQILYMILHFQLEKMVAKSKGRIAMLDINSIPKNKGWDTEKFLYYSEAMGFALIDRNQQGVDKTWNQQGVLDLDNLQHIKSILDIMEFTKAEWDDLLGITRQRKGQTQATETAQGINAARYQSSVISERMFSRFEEFRRVEYQGLLDYSKFADINSGRVAFYSDDMRLAMAECDPSEYMEAEFGIHVSRSGKDIEDLNLLKQILPNVASQNTPLSMIAEMVQSRNISRLKEVLTEREMQEKQSAMQTEKDKDAQAQRLEQIQQEYKEINYRFDSLMQQEKYDREERLAHIKGQYALADTNTPGDTIDPTAVEQNALKAQEIASKERTEHKKLTLKESDQKDKKEIALKKIEADKYKADVSLKVAKENKTKPELEEAGKK